MTGPDIPPAESPSLAEARPQEALAQLQVLGMAAQGVAVALSAAQSIVVVRLLSVQEFGLVGVALGAGGVLDVLQHFSTNSAAVRELARSTDRRHAQWVTIISVVLRLAMVVPNAAIIYLGARQLSAGLYGEPALMVPLQLLAITTAVSAFRGVLENTLTGLGAFKTYYIYLIVAFVLRLLCFWVCVSRWRVNGYFLAELVWSLSLALALVFMAHKLLGRWQGWASWPAVRSIGRAVFGLSLVLFIGQLSFTWWKRGATALMGLVASEQQMGWFHYGISYAGQILSASGALSVIYLPVMTRLARREPDAFGATLLRNLAPVLALFWLGSGVFILFAREVTLVAAGTQYQAAVVALPPLVLAFFVQALLQIINSSILIPTGNDRAFLAPALVGRALSVGLFIGVLIATRSSALAAWAMFVGLAAGLVLLAGTVARRTELRLWRAEYAALLVLVVPWIVATLLDASLLWRSGLLLVVGGAYLAYVRRSGLVDEDQLRHWWAGLRARLGMHTARVP